jgi:hypothetical protein
VRRLFIALAVVVVLLVGADFAAKAWATAQLRDRVQASVRGATSSSASITSFPFLGRLLVAGTVQEVHVSVGPVVAQRLTFSSVSVDLHDVHVDRNRLVRQQEVRLTGLGSGTVTAELTDVEISRLAGVRVSFAPGRVSVQVGATTVAATVQVSGGTLALVGARVPLRFTIPRAPLFPCDASSAVVRQGAVDVSCTINNVPPELVQAASSRSG